MSGYTKIHRTVFDHDLFAGEEFSRREAWLWMISKAAWKAHRFRHKKKMIPMAKGELPGARRHLAETWGWGEQRVRTFLDELVLEGMITLASNQQLTIITICNYSIYQFDSETSNQQLTSSQPAANHTEELKELKEDTTLQNTQAHETKAEEPKQAPSRKPIPNADRLTEILNAITAAGGKALDPTSPGLMAAQDPLIWIEAGADLELDIIPAITVAAQRLRPQSIRTWGYFAGPVRDAMHRRQQTGELFKAKPEPRRGKYDPPNDSAVLAEMIKTPVRKIEPVADGVF